MHAGIAWDAAGFWISVVDKHGKTVRPSQRFQAGDIDAMIDFLDRNGRQVVIDNANGLLDSRLAEAGITVYRADGWDPCELPLLGSASAEELARLAIGDRSALTMLTAGSGTHSGRDKELSEGYENSMDAVAAQPGPGGFLDHGPRGEKKIALTFDDGPLPPYTGQILDIIHHYSVPATFFCVGLNSISHPEIIRRIKNEGNWLGNHTWSHPHLPDLSKAQITEQIRRTGASLSAATGDDAPVLFRPPYGALPPGPYDWLTTETTTVLWDVDSKDWATPGTDAITRSVLDRARPGSIILMHDGGGDRAQTVAALPVIIETLLARDYRFVRIEDLVEEP